MSLESKAQIAELVAEKIKKENPELVRDLGAQINSLIRKYHPPWYIKLYRRARDFLYGSRDCT